MAAPLGEIAIDAPEAVRETLGGLGRTEDLKLAPGRRRIAIACYARDAIAVGDIELASSSEGPTVTLTALGLVSSPLLREPHGLDWQDDQTLVVASRAGDVSVLRLVDGRAGVDVSSARADAPGSVALRPTGDDRHEVFVCENWRNVITRFELDRSGTLTGGTATLRRWLDVPDGIAVSGSGRWLAVSNHNTHTVLVFDRETARVDGDPVAVLRGVDYPHGLRFAADDRLLVVADAGAPCVHVFAASGADWAVGAAYPAATVDVMDEATFRRGRRNPAEGGPKGIDLDRGAGVLLLTCEEAPLACFDIARLLVEPELFGSDRDALLRHELASLTAADTERRAAATARAELAAVLATRTWRLTARARGLYGSLRRVRERTPPEAAPDASPAISD